MLLTMSSVFLVGEAKAQSAIEVKNDLDTYKDDVNQGMGVLSSRIAALEGKGKLNIKGDVRYRHEIQNQKADKAPALKRQDNRGRDRVRVRLGLDKTVNKEVYAALGLATGGTEPTSTNQTFEKFFIGKTLALDYGYLQWTPSLLKGRLALTGGKMKNPLLTSATLWDSDTNPEGMFGELKLPKMTFVRGGWWDLQENSGASPLNKEYGMAVYQFEHDVRLAGWDTQWAMGYTQVLFANKLAGNATWDPIAKGGNVKNLKGVLLDFKVLDGFLQLKRKVGKMDLAILFQTTHNMTSFDIRTADKTAKNNNENAYITEVNLGKIALKNDYAFGLRWGYLQPNAVYGGFTDSDSGFCNRKFLRAFVGYGLAEGLELDIAGFGLRRVNYDVLSTKESRKTAYTTLIDLVVKI